MLKEKNVFLSKEKNHDIIGSFTLNLIEGFQNCF